MMRLSIRHLNSLAKPALFDSALHNLWEMRHRRPGYNWTAVAPTQSSFHGISFVGHSI